MDKFSIAEIDEEYEENERTGIEREIDPDSGKTSEQANPDPWDPNKIRVDQKPYSLKQLLEMIAEKEIDLAPDFQRNTVWKPVQKCRLIESIFLRIPLPAFYFSASEDGLLQVVDGVQRLSTIRDFAGLGSEHEAFVLNGLEYLQDEVGGKRYKDLTGTVWLRRLNQTQVFANVIDPQTPTPVKFAIFKRINTGGSPLNAQEIRHCISRPRSRDFLKKLAGSEAFVQATNGTFRNNVRMVDREVVLRFCAFKSLKGNYDEYSKHETVDEFLTSFTEQIDNKAINETDLRDLENSFLQAMHNSHRLFGDYAFRKWPINDNRVNPFNRALFEAWSVLLSRYSWKQLERAESDILNKARELMSSDSDFIASITSSTSNVKKVMTRFSKVDQLLRGVLHES